MAKSTINVRILGDNKGLNKALGESESMVGAFATNVGKLGLLAGAAVVGGAVAAGVGLFKLGQNFDKEFDKIRIGTGATGDALAGLEDSFKDVLKGNNRATFDTAGTAIADLNTRLGITGDELEALSGQFINLSSITETDVKTNIDNLTRVFGDWEIATGDQATALDQVYRAAQSSGIGLGDLSTSVVQFGAPLRNLGFGFDESLALLAQFNKTGVNTETVFAGMKAGVGKLAKAGEDVPETFSRVVAEIEKLGPGTEATALAIELFGQRAGPDLADAIAGGKFQIDEMLGAITDGTDTINTAAKDTEDFGEKWNGIKNRVLTGLQPLAAKVFDGVGKAMDKLGPYVDRATAWLSVNLPKAAAVVQEWFEKNWPKIQATIAAVFDWLVDDAWPVVQRVLGLIRDGVTEVVAWFEQNWPTIRSTIESVVAWLRDDAWPVIQQVWDGIVTGAQGLYDWFQQYWPRIQATVDQFVTWFRDDAWPVIQQFIEFIRAEFDKLVLWTEENWPKIRETIEGVIEAIVVIIEWVVTAVTYLWEHFGADLIALAESSWESMKNIIQAAIDIVRGIIDTVTSLIRGDWDGAWEGIKTALSGVWDLIKSIVSGALDQIKIAISAAWDEVDDLFAGAWDEIKGFFSDTWDFLKDTVSGGIDSIVGFVADLPGEIASVAAGAFDSIWESFKSIINRIIGAWNNLEFSIPGFDPPGPGPKIPGITLSTPNIPTLATGGVLTGPTLFVGGEYAGARQNPEIVAPRSAMVDAVREAMGDGGGDRIGLQVNGDVRLDGIGVEEVARSINFMMAA